MNLRLLTVCSLVLLGSAAASLVLNRIPYFFPTQEDNVRYRPEAASSTTTKDVPKAVSARKQGTEEAKLLAHQYGYGQNSGAWGGGGGRCDKDDEGGEDSIGREQGRRPLRPMLQWELMVMLLVRLVRHHRIRHLNH